MRAAQETHARIEEDRSSLGIRVQQLERDIAAMEVEHDAKLSAAVEESIAEFKTRCGDLEASLVKVCLRGLGDNARVHVPDSQSTTDD
jgi:hypothetical protein